LTAHGGAITGVEGATTRSTRLSAEMDIVITGTASRLTVWSRRAGTTSVRCERQQYATIPAPAAGGGTALA
jgi:hypothetical protein